MSKKEERKDFGEIVSDVLNASKKLNEKLDGFVEALREFRLPITNRQWLNGLDDQQFVKSIIDSIFPNDYPVDMTEWRIDTTARLCKWLQRWHKENDNDE